MNDRLSPKKDFAALSLVDLLEAREMFHVHLMYKKNVVGTAVGRYLIRRKDPFPTREELRTGVHHARAAAGPKPPKSLEDCEVRSYSWPCVLVFVNQWVDENQFGGGQYDRSDFVPPAIYLPDGRKVPVCVVEARPQETMEVTPAQMAFPSKFLGGGYPVITRVQEELHMASVGCMVTDGHKAYALTNRHVAGEPGEIVYALVDGKQVPIGKSSKKQLPRRPFEEIYTGWPGREVFLHMDIGLIEVSDKTRWTAQVYGIGELGELVDLSVHNLSLRLIGSPVRAYGCASHQMFGQIQALFYRYKSVGGSEYVSDFLIGPRPGHKLLTAHGDSGTLWLLDEEEIPAEAKRFERARDPERLPLCPIAVQWGGQVFSDGKQCQPYALATCLSTVCDKLDIDVVRDWNIGLPEYWGAVGHYTIAEKAIEALPNGALKNLMQANLGNITYAPGDIDMRNFKGLSKKPFVPLADVPDYVWKMGPRRNHERPNHFADMDRKDSKNQTLLDICQTAPQNVAVNIWQRYYEDVGDSGKGLLPFRVWQFFDAMTQFARVGETEKFLCAAGIVSHYVGDACQPLHISYLHDGDPDHLDGNGDPHGTGVHSAYEDGMVNAYTEGLLQNVNGKAAGIPAFAAINDGHDAAVRTVQLMQDTFDTIKPMSIVQAFAPIASETKSDIADALWKQFGDDTIKVMSTGTKLLAFLWQEAWRVGNGEKNIGNHAAAINQDNLVKLYEDQAFMTSYTLDQVGQILGGGVAAAAASAGANTGGGPSPRGGAGGGGSNPSGGRRGAHRGGLHHGSGTKPHPHAGASHRRSASERLRLARGASRRRKP